MDSADFEFLCEFLKRRSGLVLTPDKISIAKNKLAPVARRFGFRKTDALLAELRYEPEELSRAVTEAVTVNESSFFRDKACFDHVRGTILPQLVHARAAAKRLRIWCAATSSGQEAYSLAILLDEMGLADQGWKIDLIATDLSSEMIARARDGRYFDYEIARGMPTQTLLKYFTEGGNQWCVSDRLRRVVSFRPFNLLDSFGWLGRLDLVFCRNVLLYFDAQEKLQTLDRLSRIIASDGFLVTGTSDVMAGENFIPVENARGVFTISRAAALAG